MEALSTDDAKAGVGVAEHKDGIGLCLGKELVGAVDDVAAGGAEVVADSVHVDFGLCELEVVEEDAVEVVVVVLTCVGEDDIEILAAFGDDGGETDYLGTGADNDNEFQLTVVLELYVGIIKFGLLVHNTLIGVCALR